MTSLECVQYECTALLPRCRQLSESHYVRETGRPLRDWPAYCTHILLYRPPFPCRGLTSDNRGGMESIWRIYWMHILWVIAAGPDPHMIILETEGLVVVYGISCWQEQPVITAEHSAHRKRWFIVKRICSKKKRKRTGKEEKGVFVCQLHM